MAGAGALLGRLVRTRAWRANARVGERRGIIIAAGIAFYGVFSLFPLLVLGLAAAGLVIGGNEQLQQELVGFVRTALPGAIGEGEDALVSADELLAQATSTSILGWSALVGVGALLFTGLGWIGALREGVRSMFAMPVMDLDPVRAKLYDLVVLLTLGLLIVASALVSVVTQAFTEELLALVGLRGSRVGGLVTGGLVPLVGFGLNTALFLVLFRVLARSTAPYRTIVSGAALAAFGTAVLQMLVSVLIRNVGGGLGFLSAFVPVLALFVWLNLNARVLLFGAAWAAVGRTPPEPADDPVLVAAPVAPAPPLPPVLPVRWTDRAVLGAGVVLGASGYALVQLAGGAARAAGAGLRALGRDDD